MSMSRADHISTDADYSEDGRVTMPIKDLRYLTDRIEKAEEIIAEKDEALKIYADGKHWAEFISTDGNIFDEQDGDPVYAFSEGNGQPSSAARKALALKLDASPTEDKKEKP